MKVTPLSTFTSREGHLIQVIEMEKDNSCKVKCIRCDVVFSGTIEAQISYNDTFITNVLVDIQVPCILDDSNIDSKDKEYAN